MTRKGEKRGSERETFSVTTPFLPAAPTFLTEPATLRASHIQPRSHDVDEFTEVEMTGQEFALFAGVQDGKSADAFARRYGLLGLHSALRRPHGLSGPDLWRVLLAQEEEAYWGELAFREPLEDWLAMAGLLRFSFGLLGLLRDESARARVSNTLGGGAARERTDRAAAGPWITSLLEGAVRAGLEFALHPSDPEVVVFEATGPRVRSRGTWPPPDWIPLQAPMTAAGINEALADLLNPWLGGVRPAVAMLGGKLAPAAIPPTDLLTVLWIQLANAALSEVQPRRCAWDRCPGPPERPNLFLWRWGRTPTGTKHRDAIYCHPRCAHAAAMANSRAATGGYRQKKVSEDRRVGPEEV